MAKADNVTVTGNLAHFVMTTTWQQGGISYDVAVEVNFEGVHRDELVKITFSGSSFRVRLNSWLKAKKARWDKAVQDGRIKVKWTDVIGRKAEVADLGDILMRMSRTDFLTFCTTKMGMTQELAEQYYESTHENI